MKKTEIVLIGVIMIIFVVIIVSIKNHFEFSKDIQDESKEKNENHIEYNENVSIDELKENTGILGNSDIYEIETEYDGRKALTVKASLKYKVAFAGMVKKLTPKMEELDDILISNLPKQNGIWIEESSREKLLNLLNGSKSLNTKYDINEYGYLTTSQNDEQTSFDQILENKINDNKLYIVTVSSMCYIVDDITGEILDYNFENMDQYQTYEYFEDNDKFIIFITENRNHQLEDNEIVDSFITLLKNIT